MASRVYVNRTEFVDEMLALAPGALGLPEDAPASVRIEAWLVFAKTTFDGQRPQRTHTESSDVEDERLTAVRAANVAAAATGLL